MKIDSYYLERAKSYFADAIAFRAFPVQMREFEAAAEQWSWFCLLLYVSQA